MLGHGDPSFVAIFGRVLSRMREVFRTKSAQPFVLAGSGTLGMEVAASNLFEPNDTVVVVETGVFGARMVNILERQGIRVVRVTAEVGDAPPLDAIDKALATGNARAITVTHVDTSTAVLAPVRAIAELARRHGVLSIVDGVCSIGAEAMHQDEWGIDLVLTASQKAIAAPPGLSLLSLSPRAIEAIRTRKSPVRSYYMDLNGWLPVMQAYEAGKPAYYATPAVGLVRSLDASLERITKEGMDAREKRHERIAEAFRAAWRALELEEIPRSELCAHTLSAVRYPEKVTPELVARIRAEGVAVATGLHPQNRDSYFRVGHMGEIGSAEVLTTIGAIERALRAFGHAPATSGVAAAQQVLTER